MQFHILLWRTERVQVVMLSRSEASRLQRDRPFAAAQGDTREPLSQSVFFCETALSALSIRVMMSALKS